MKLSEIELYRLEKATKNLCQARNQNTPAELGKVQYTIGEEGVSFFKLNFLLDSSHVDYECPVAKLVFEKSSNRWYLLVAERQEPGCEASDWYEYPYLPATSDFDAQISELFHDPENVFW